MKTALVIVLLALCAAACNKLILLHLSFYVQSPADATNSQAASNVFKKSYEVIEKLLADKRPSLTAEQEKSVEESLKALTTLQTDLDPESEEYFWAQLLPKLFSWAIQSGCSSRATNVIEKLLADKRPSLTAEQEKSVAESLKALTTLQTDLDPESEEYFFAQLLPKIFAWAIQKGVSKATEYGVGKAIQKG
ncbi:hypothetical protein MTO96_030281 [Rhipicephalus appendiculatus]